MGNAHQRRKERRERERDARGRLWFILEHPLLASGAVAMLIAGIAVEISGWSGLAGAFYAAALLFLILVFIRADLFRLDPRRPWVILIVSAICLFALWLAIWPEPPQSASELAKEIAKELPVVTPTAAPKPTPTPNVWELQYNSRQSMFEMPDKMLPYYPPEFAIPLKIRCRLEYHAERPGATSLIVYIPAEPPSVGTKEVVGSAHHVMDNYRGIVDSILADAKSDKANAMALRGQTIKPNRVVFYHASPITPDGVSAIFAFRRKDLVTIERYGPKTTGK